MNILTVTSMRIECLSGLNLCLVSLECPFRVSVFIDGPLFDRLIESLNIKSLVNIDKDLRITDHNPIQSQQSDLITFPEHIISSTSSQ